MSHEGMNDLHPCSKSKTNEKLDRILRLAKHGRAITGEGSKMLAAEVERVTQERNALRLAFLSLVDGQKMLEMFDKYSGLKHTKEKTDGPRK